MEVNLTLLMASMLFLALGAVVGYYTRQSIASKQLTTAEGKANSIIEEAKQKYKEETLNAKNKAVEILVKQFSVLSEGVDETTQSQKDEIQNSGKPEDYAAVLDKEAESEMEDKSGKDVENMSIEELKGLSTRTLNALKDNKITKVKGIVKLSTEELNDLSGMGEKGVKEIKKAIGLLGLILKSN